MLILPTSVKVDNSTFSVYIYIDIEDLTLKYEENLR